MTRDYIMNEIDFEAADLFYKSVSKRCIGFTVIGSSQNKDNRNDNNDNNNERITSAAVDGDGVH